MTVDGCQRVQIRSAIADRVEVDRAEALEVACLVRLIRGTLGSNGDRNTPLVAAVVVVVVVAVCIRWYAGTSAWAPTSSSTEQQPCAWSERKRRAQTDLGF
jgi:hypothetical protein